MAGHGTASYLQIIRSSLREDVRNFAHWDPINNKLHCAIRDAGYLVIDIPRFFSYTHSNYGALRRYLRQARINKGKVNPEDFRDVDTNVLRESLIRHAQWKGPLQKIDFRFFYWMYGVMIFYVLWQGLALQRMRDNKLDKTGSTLEQRRSMYDDDYMEDVRPR
ncbi:hypothetical protein STCU_02639 [Strigomonas culicis]|uniref:Uncharacterized protein n=1 Tax=Strigomonas culicis TaxID=28005 RepID=S9UV67_9TRYP|nr:hypothetical protein STCU_07957 [Strigomonas culicis]EPY32798.1 hypothetical protein STCU_02639 [Strigomonas culicis]|eukprot:EPY23001.1 hypothetical protein STCU_07957 [Strigomonas culicis]